MRKLWEKKGQQQLAVVHFITDFFWPTVQSKVTIFPIHRVLIWEMIVTNQLLLQYLYLVESLLTTLLTSLAESWASVVAAEWVALQLKIQTASADVWEIGFGGRQELELPVLHEHLDTISCTGMGIHTVDICIKHPPCIPLFLQDWSSMCLKGDNYVDCNECHRAFLL